MGNWIIDCIVAEVGCEGYIKIEILAQNSYTRRAALKLPVHWKKQTQIKKLRGNLVLIETETEHL